MIGVIGTFNSGCAEIIAPILNRAQNGPVAMVSPANTYVGLTHGGPGTAAGEPEKYQPTGKKSYARVVAADDFQGAADAILAKQLGLKKVYILNDKEAYGQGVATNFRNALGKQGVAVAGFTAWDGKASSYEALATKIRSSGADGVFLGGLICENGGKLVKDLRATLGNERHDHGARRVHADLGRGRGRRHRRRGHDRQRRRPPELAADGRREDVRDGLQRRERREGRRIRTRSTRRRRPRCCSTRSSGRTGRGRRSAEEVFNTDIKNGILGTFKIDANGDTTSNPVTIYKIKGGKSTEFKVITPPTDPGQGGVGETLRTQ